jgi:hypothetical protein
MTHTLHRRGDINGLGEDYVMLVLAARGVNFDGSQEKMRQIWEIISHYEPNLANFGNITSGNSHRTSMETLKKATTRIAHAVFKDRETLEACLKELKDGDFGLSVVISGLYEDVEQICTKIKLSPHTVQHSLGILGKTDKLPDENILEITTMCGHGIVSSNLVKQMLKRIGQGAITYAEAAKGLSKICACGIFNPYRAEKLLRKMAAIRD